ncbi:MAG: insulinase family protein, partial [Methylobacteriaceae bacterium]|nr:insulinase family protein [Methylobacteriaceae bacterium]
PSSPAESRQGGGPAITHSRLENGLQIVVIPDHRTPVVTHMIWYQNGSADDPPGKSGIAHFLEHLMFKGTKAHPKGFSDLVAELGGQENAFTAYDYTAYFQRVAKEHLATMMGFEADRMTGLILTDDVVAPERDVVLEERRMRTDTDPAQQLNEAVQASLFPHHPYGTPVIGWGHEIETLDRADALAYYERFYTPANAILIVAGDVDAAEVERMARETYGRIPAREKPPRRFRPQEPEPRAHRLVTLADAKVEQPQHERVFLVPSYTTGAPGEAEALEVLTHLLGGGHTSLLYRELVVERKLAVAVGAYYMGTSLDATRLWIYAMPTPGTNLDELDRALDEVIARMADHPVDDADLVRARTRLVADAIYAQDNQASLARWYGASLATSLTIEDITRWPERIEAVTAQDVQKAARTWLDKRRAVTGFLLPEAAAA